MNIKETKIEKVWLIELEAFDDHRGHFLELYNRNEYRSHFGVFFVQDDVSVSNKNVLRGIHGDKITWKLVTCLHGTFFVVVVNCDEKSEQYLKHEVHILSDRNHHQLLVAPERGLAILALEDASTLHYKQSEYYHGMDAQFTLKWDDPRIGIIWPIENPILSKRDSGEKEKEK
jgi:dTDP-4-dehydrorhamnose 3,5-epimerase